MFLLVGILVVIAGVVALSAYEAHVVNVTAHIENALKAFTAEGDHISFGTVFPQEYRERRLWITSSESFCAGDQRRVLAIDYKIVQKPKPIWPEPIMCLEPEYPDFETIDEARIYCHQNPEDLDCCYPLLCPYLSKIPAYEDPYPYTDYGVPAFHEPEDIAIGTIHKDNDLQDEWIIDLDVPCFEGMCAQDWEHPGWELPAELEDSDFGCDLWVEVTRIY